MAARNRLSASFKWQNPDGIFRFQPDSKGKVPPAQPFMMGIYSGALADYWDWLEKDPRIITCLSKMYDGLQALWVPETKAWKYLEYPGYVSDNGEAWGDGQTGSQDLNCLMLKGLGLLYRETRNEKWKKMGDTALEGAMGIGNNGAAWLDGFKQFNQTMLGIEYFRYVL
jgi:hypothetical protein